MIIKRFSMFGFFLATLFVLAACGGAPATQAAQTEAQAEPVLTEAAATEAIVPTDAPTAMVIPTDVPTDANVSAPAGPSFSSEVQPILQANCTRCHGGSGGLSLNSYAAVMAGGVNGPVIVPGDAANSRLVQYISSGRMPRGGQHLLDQDIQTITDWVNSGAPDN